MQVEGKSRDLPPLVRDEVYRIACESLRNAFRHAQAKRIDVEFHYGPRQFSLRVVDNGKGIDPAILSAGARAGHHGLPGLNERAQVAGGQAIGLEPARFRNRDRADDSKLDRLPQVLTGEPAGVGRKGE